MAILYVFTVNDPNNVGVFPPSVVESDWAQNITRYFADHGVGGLGGADGVIFADKTTLDAFLAEYTLTDASLLADIATWKSAHNVSYSNKYYELPDAGITSPGVVS